MLLSVPQKWLCAFSSLSLNSRQLKWSLWLCVQWWLSQKSSAVAVNYTAVVEATIIFTVEKTLSFFKHCCFKLFSVRMGAFFCRLWNVLVLPSELIVIYEFLSNGTNGASGLILMCAAKRDKSSWPMLYLHPVFALVSHSVSHNRAYWGFQGPKPYVSFYFLFLYFKKRQIWP